MASFAPKGEDTGHFRMTYLLLDINDKCCVSDDSLLAWGALGVDAEGDETVVDVVGQGVGNHGEEHDDVLAGLLHGEEGDDVVGQVLPAQAFEQYPAHAQLQCQADEETEDKQQQFTLDIVLALEYPIAVPHKTVDHAQDVAYHIGDTVRQSQLGVQQIESHQRDKRVGCTYHCIFEQLYARLAGFGFIYLHDNSL